jgi:hypothetical protein
MSCHGLFVLGACAAVHAFAPPRPHATLRRVALPVATADVVSKAPTAAAWREACDASGVTSFADFGIKLAAAGVVSKAPAKAALAPTEHDVPAVIVGSGRIGSMLKSDGDAVMTSSSGWPADAPTSGPVYVCTRNDALASVIEAVPEDRRADLCFLQNGMLGPFLEGQGLGDATQVLVYLAVAKLGETPTDGVTDANPEGLTAATGKWADAFASRLALKELTCHVKEGDAFAVAMLEKHVWICAFMLVGATHGCSVGDVEQKHAAEFDALAAELLDAGAEALGVAVPAGAPERLKAYARTVAHFPTAVKEFEWRNGWFYKITNDAVAAGKEDPMPLHTQKLYDLELPLPVAWMAQ